MRRALLSILCCSLLGLFPAPAGAEDAAEGQPSPEEAYKAKVATLGAPSAEAGFRFAGVLLLNGKRAGHARLSAMPGKADDGTLRWHAKDALMIKLSATPTVRVVSVQLDQHLTPLQGRLHTLNPGEPTVDWVRTDSGVRTTETTTKGQVKEEAVRNFAFDDTALTTMAATALFCRSVLDSPGTYATNVLEVRDALKGEPILNRVVFKVEGKLVLPGGQEVLAVSGKKGPDILRLLFDPKSRLPIAVRLQTAKAKIEILAADKWDLPATSPTGAALRTALALATRNMEILDDVTHWATLHKRALASRSEEDKQKEAPDLETFRKKVLAQWEKSLPQNPPEMIKPLLEASADQIQLEKLESGLVRATLPETFKSVQMVLGEEGGIWYLVALVGKKQ